jgi:hypothetical protein
MLLYLVHEHGLSEHLHRLFDILLLYFEIILLCTP